ncbi:MAG: type II toxin-antitoxin system RelE/ParE family toxin [Planctomycetales bacterium]|nr:type II toxin-antitoxin system RelE/ParE family toxin [Planctomycetales bacterium]
MSERQVFLTQRAKSDLKHYFEFAAERAPSTALQWLNRFKESLNSLSLNAERCSLAPEDGLLKRAVRQLIFGKQNNRYRALFVIEEQRVVVLHIRRGGMDTANKNDLGPPNG